MSDGPTHVVDPGADSEGHHKPRDGMGMLILQRRVGMELHIGEDIRVRVHRVRGERVWIAVHAPLEVPVRREEVVEIPITPPDPAQAVPAFRVLVVEDDPAHARLTLDALAKRSWVSPRVASDGPSALAALEADPPLDLIVMDLHLPGMDGMELLAKVRASRPATRLPVVMFSSSEDEGQIAQCLAAGASAFVTKPPKLDEFRQALLTTVDFWAQHRRGAAKDASASRTL